MRLYVSDEIQQLDRYILYFIDGSSKRCPAMWINVSWTDTNQRWMHGQNYSVQSKQCRAVLQEIIKNGFISQWSVDGATVVETDESKIWNSLLCLLKNKLKVWIRTSLIDRSHCFKWWIPICIKTYHQQQISVAPWSTFTTRSIAEKQITGNKKNFLKVFRMFWRLGRVKISS